MHDENFFFQAEDGIRDKLVTGVQTCALPISYGLVSNCGNLRSGKLHEIIRANKSEDYTHRKRESPTCRVVHDGRRGKQARSPQPPVIPKPGKRGANRLLIRFVTARLKAARHLLRKR